MTRHLLRAAGGAVLALAVVVLPGRAQDADERRAWNQPVEPFRIAGNIYYVGAAGVSAFLVVTPEGSILLDGGLPETAPLIAASITRLGFRIGDVKYLLNSHAHFDHAGGLAELKRLSGASVIASAGDAPALRKGGRNLPAVDVDRVVADGDTVRVGSAVMTAVLTPGHTPGCTSWTTTTVDAGREVRVLFHCSTSVVDRLVGNRAYPQIVSDYEKSFTRLRSLSADVFLGAHPVFFDMQAKRQRVAAGAPNPFVDPTELGTFVQQSERAFRAALEKERQGGAAAER